MKTKLIFKNITAYMRKTCMWSTDGEEDGLRLFVIVLSRSVFIIFSFIIFVISCPSMTTLPANFS